MQYRWFPHLSKNNDEPVYLFQAEMLRSGHLTLPAWELGQSFRPWMSGITGDRLVMVFLPGWPAVLAVGVTLVGSFKVVGATAAAFGVLAVYALALEILGEQRAALVAGAFVGLSPLMLILGGTVLSYPFALGVGAVLATLALRAARTGSPRGLVWAGISAGVLVTMRPLDAVLVSAVCGLHVAWCWRRRLSDVVRGLAWAAFGAGPFVAAVAATNWRTTGSPLTFPLDTNGGDNRLGFGLRQISDGARVFRVTPHLLEHATVRLLGEMPHWTLGGLLVVPLVVWGAVRIGRRRPAAVPTLVLLAAAYPCAYFFYWGTHFVFVGRRDYGPFYFLPMLVPLGVAVGEGISAVARRSRIAAALVVVAMLATLPASLAPKERRARAHNLAAGREARLVDRLPKRSLVVLPGSNDGPWMLHVRGYFSNPPDLGSDRLFAADTGAGNVGLLDRFPDRPMYQLYGLLHGDRVEGHPDPVVARLRRVRGASIDIAATFENRTPNPTVVAYVGVPDGVERCVLDEESSEGRTYTISWKLTPTAVVRPPGCAPLPPLFFDGRPLNGNLVVGFSASATTELDGVDRWEYLYALRAERDVEVLVPGVQRRTSAGDLGDPRADFPGQVDHLLRVDVSPTPIG